MTDLKTTDFATLRKAMVEGQLRAGGVIDRTILSVMGRIPRELFVPEAQRPLAYLDEALPLGAHRSLPAPAALGLLLQLAEVRDSETVLDVACGTGYATAVLAGLARSVTAIDDDPALIEAARANLAALSIPATITQSALAKPALREVFDVIIVEGALDTVPEALLSRLADGGRLVTAMGRGAAAIATIFTATQGTITRTEHFNLGLPSLSAFARHETFTF